MRFLFVFIILIYDYIFKVYIQVWMSGQTLTAGQRWTLTSELVQYTYISST